VNGATLAATAAAEPRRRLRDAPWFLRAVAGVALLAAWELVVRAFAPADVAKPTGIVLAIEPVLADPQFRAAAGATLEAVAVGLAISIIGGTAVGLLMGRARLADAGLRYYVNSLFSTPMVTILPLVTLWFGYSGDARLAVVVFAAIFSITVNVCDGARSVPPEYLEVGRSFRASGWRTIVEVVLPSSLPYLLAGLRLAAGRALIGAVVAEFFASIPGLGYYILFNSRTFKHNEAFVAVLVLVAAGVGFEVVVGRLTRRYLPWARRT
jgi:ABC-type nitrate/sulfonate/bicarbonate transport system permease component